MKEGALVLRYLRIVADRLLFVLVARKGNLSPWMRPPGVSTENDSNSGLQTEISAFADSPIG